MKIKPVRWVIEKYRAWEDTHFDDPIVYKIERFWIDIMGADYWVMWQGFKNLHLLTESAFWPYVFAPNRSDGFYIETICCRLAGHPRGPIYYNPYGTEPNYHCKTCYDDGA